MSQFEWNEEKRQINLEKHGLDFLDAALIFDDLTRVEHRCLKGDEERHRAIGTVNGVVIFLVYTKRKGNYRIISARKASQKERSYYEQHQKQ